MKLESSQVASPAGRVGHQHHPMVAEPARPLGLRIVDHDRR
jgi:hypothetical protein